MNNENTSDAANLKHIKTTLIVEYCYSRLPAYGYEVVRDLTSQAGDIEDAIWRNPKTGYSFMMMTTEEGVELFLDTEPEAASDRAFFQEIVTEGVLVPDEYGNLIASYTQSLDMLLPAIRNHLKDEQLLRCVRSKPCVDWSWLERGYISPPR